MEMIEAERRGIVFAGYDCEIALGEKVGCDQYFQQVLMEFGLRYLRGTAIAIQNPDGDGIYNAEKLMRKFLSDEPIDVAIEVGTWRGVSTALIAHYANIVNTVDITNRQEPWALWYFFGVVDRIRPHVVPSNEVKQEVIKAMKFDFAFVDAVHTFEGVKLDFECVKKCGRVLFHDYQVMRGVTQFVDTLPDEQVIKQFPFAYWKANGHL